MPSNKMFMSPRSDLTIRNLTAEQVEAISNAACDIVGGVVSFSESAIYESEDTTALPGSGHMQCSRKLTHEAHTWGENDKWFCAGFERVETAICPYPRMHTHHPWSTEHKEYHCPGRARDLDG